MIGISISRDLRRMYADDQQSQGKMFSGSHQNHNKILIYSCCNGYNVKKMGGNKYWKGCPGLGPSYIAKWFIIYIATLENSL